MKKPANIGHATGVQSDVPRDCRSFKLHASGCGCEYFCLCVCFSVAGRIGLKVLM